MIDGNNELENHIYYVCLINVILYLFVFTDSITGFLFNVLQMSKLKSSILISFQYSIIIFLTAKIYRVKAT